MEFYRAATSVLPENNNISPDVGRIFGSNRYVDFYVNGTLQWAIELLREGSKSAEHEDRFKPGGLYYTMKSHIKEYVILDFRRTNVTDKEDNFWYVMYNENYTIARKDDDDEIVKLWGSGVSSSLCNARIRKC